MKYTVITMSIYERVSGSPLLAMLLFNMKGVHTMYIGMYAFLSLKA